MIVFGGLELVLAELAVGVVAGERLEQFPSFPGKQLSQDFFAFTQAQPLQEPDLLHLQHAILPSRDLPLVVRQYCTRVYRELKKTRNKLRCDLKSVPGG